MKIGVMTFHRALNYGAVLQAYALQHAFLRRGADCEIVDYRCPAIESAGRPFYFYRREKSLRHLAGALVKTVILPARRAVFSRFLRQNMRLSAPVYDRRALVKALDRYDLIIAGGDQVWNAAITGDDEAYYLLDVKERKRRASFAASFGSGDILAGTTEAVLKERLSGFGCLLIRENSAARQIGERFGLWAAVCADPVFLLERAEWEAFAAPVARAPYALVYTVKKDDVLTQTARAWAKQNGLGFINLSSPLNALTPREFLGCFARARAVYTNSFHGVAFSAIFRRPFLAAIANSEGENVRASELLETLGLRDCVYNANRREPDLNMNWHNAEDTMSRLREYALRYVCALNH